MNVAATLKRKYGPLPAWAWLALLAVVLVVYRHLRGGGGGTSSTSADTTSTNGAGSGSDGDLGRGAAAGDTGTGGLTPSDQTTADPALTGPGTAVVFDPITGNTDPVQEGPPDYVGPGTAPTVPQTSRAPAATTTPRESSRPSGRPKKGQVTTGTRPAPELISEHGAGQMRVKRTPPRPSSSRGQTAPRPTLKTERADVAAVAHPESVAHAPSVAPTRAQQNAAVAVERPRSDSSVHVDTGARTVAAASTVGVAQTQGQVRAMGRKMEVG